MSDASTAARRRLRPWRASGGTEEISWQWGRTPDQELSRGSNSGGDKKTGDQSRVRSPQMHIAGGGGGGGSRMLPPKQLLTIVVIIFFTLSFIKPEAAEKAVRPRGGRGGGGVPRRGWRRGGGGPRGRPARPWRRRRAPRRAGGRGRAPGRAPLAGQGVASATLAPELAWHSKSAKMAKNSTAFTIVRMTNL
ncbi:hypothetical protein SEVIR_5G347266v4 [Setaria viridis]